MNKINHVVTNNIKNKNQCDDAIEYNPKFDNVFSVSSEPNRYPLPAATVSLRGGNKKIPTLIDGLTYMWDSGSTNRMI